MKLKYRTGYFLSVMTTMVGLVLLIGHIDLNRYFMLAGAIGIIFSVLYYFISDYNKEYDWRQWANLGVCLFMILLLVLHFVLHIKVDYFILAGVFLIKPYERKTESKWNIESND